MFVFTEHNNGFGMIVAWLENSVLLYEIILMSSPIILFAYVNYYYVS